jgi:hypothetical protein
MLARMVAEVRIVLICGPPAGIPDDLKAAALRRLMAFDQRGTVRA